MGIALPGNRKCYFSWHKCPFVEYDAVVRRSDLCTCVCVCVCVCVCRGQVVGKEERVVDLITF